MLIMELMEVKKVMFNHGTHGREKGHVIMDFLEVFELEERETNIFIKDLLYSNS